MTGAKFRLFILFFFLNWACISAQDRIFTDDLGLTVRMASPPQRIISLAPNITEILYALNLGVNIVGVTRFCDYPPEALEKEKIGGLVDPDLEMIISLNPDLIIGFRGNPLPLLEKMREFHLPVFILEMGTTVDSVFTLIRTVGDITWTEDRTDTLIEALNSRYTKILDSLQGLQHTPTVFFSLHGTGLWTCGKDSFMDDLLTKARGKNIAGNIRKSWLLFSREQLIHEDPDYIIILSKTQKEFLKAKEWMKQRAYLKNLQAVKKENIYFLDENLATRPGPRIIDALDHLVHIIHPDRFSSKW